MPAMLSHECHARSGCNFPQSSASDRPIVTRREASRGSQCLCSRRGYLDSRPTRITNGSDWLQGNLQNLRAWCLERTKLAAFPTPVRLGNALPLILSSAPRRPSSERFELLTLLHLQFSFVACISTLFLLTLTLAIPASSPQSLLRRRPSAVPRKLKLALSSSWLIPAAANQTTTSAACLPLDE